MAHETILVIDDEALIRRTVGKRLQTDGYAVVEAQTGHQALERAANGVDLAILDYRLPDIDGLAVLKQLKQLDPAILVILLTAYASVESTVSAMTLGALHVLNKPFDLEALVALVEQALERERIREYCGGPRVSRPTAAHVAAPGTHTSALNQSRVPRS